MATTTALAASSEPHDSARAEAGEPRADVPLEEVEQAIVDLLRAYKRALKHAADLPLVARLDVAVKKGSMKADEEVGYESRRFGFEPPWLKSLVHRARWGARWSTRLYVETHIRKQLQAVRGCLRLELLGTTSPDARTRIAALEEELADRTPSLLGWRRLWSPLARLPTLAAAVPVVWAASFLPLEGVSVGSASDALVIAGLTALGFWALVAWPTVKLGFRVKRAIFTGGTDLAHPFFDKPGEVRWERFADAPAGSPTAYEAEDAVFKTLGGRRKPAEAPLDMLFSFLPYFSFAFMGFMLWALVDAARNGFEGFSWDTIGGTAFIVAIFVLPFKFIGNARRNHRNRQR